MESSRRMRKSGVGCNPGNSRKSASAGRRTIRESNNFNQINSQKTENCHNLLPYLEERIALKVPSDFKYLERVLNYISQRMVSLGIADPEDTDVILALDEAIVNAIKHGNKCNPEKCVHIIAVVRCDGVWFTITDEGSGFARDEVPDPTDPCRLLEPSGRGLLLINHIMDEVCYNDCGNEVQMFKRLDQQAQQDQPQS
jgi:serine/threonine-protein kinase RsbW